MIGEFVAAEMAGTVAGVILALIFLPPPDWRGFFQRFFAGLIFGTLFGPVAHWRFGLDETSRMIAAAHGATAFASWWIMGAVRRMAEAWKGKG